MPSFTKLFSIAAVAFAAFASAMPAVGTANDIVGRSCGACAAPGVPSLPAIIADLEVDVKVNIDLLTAIKKETCTVDVVKPIVLDLCTKIDVAVGKVLVLSKYKINEILFNGDVVITVQTLGHLICSLVITILTAVGCVLRILGGVKGDVHGLLCLVGVAVARLLHCICGVVDGLLAELVIILCAELKVVFWVCVRLGLVDLYALLKINVSLYL